MGAPCQPLETELPQAGNALHQSTDDEIDGHHMAGISGDGAAMEYLVESKDPRPWVRPSEGIYDGSCNVADSSRDNEPDDGWTGHRRLPEQPEECDARHAEDDVHDRI